MKKKEKEKEPEKPSWPETLYVAEEPTDWTGRALVGHDSEEKVYIPSFGDESQCVGVYRLVDIRTIRKVRVVEPGCKEER